MHAANSKAVKARTGRLPINRRWPGTWTVVTADRAQRRRWQWPRISAVPRIHRDTNAQIEIKRMTVDRESHLKRAAQPDGQQLGAGW